MASFFGGGSTTTTNELDPLARQVLEQIIGQTNAFQASNPPFVAPLDTASIQGLQQLQDRPQSPFIGTATDQIGATLGGDFFGQNPGTTGFNAGLQGVTSAITDAATRGVGDQFSLAGRTGSPAQSITLGKTIANALAPFQFGAFENQLGREFGAFENERQRQLSALGLTPTVESLQDAQARRLLGVGDIVQGQNQRTLTEPQQSFEFFLNPLLSAVGGLPLSSTETGKASGSQIVSGIGGVLGGLGSIFSSSEFKEDLGEMAPALDKVKNIPKRKWKYKEHMGPMAEEWAENFGGDGKTISGTSAWGVVLKALQEVAEKLDVFDLRLEKLEANNG